MVVINNSFSVSTEIFWLIWTTFAMSWAQLWLMSPSQKFTNLLQCM